MNWFIKSKFISSILNDIIYTLELNFEIEIFEDKKIVVENEKKNNLSEKEINEVLQFEKYLNLDNVVIYDLEKDDEIVEDSDSSFCKENLKKEKFKNNNINNENFIIKKPNLKIDEKKKEKKNEKKVEEVENQKKKLNIIKRSYKEIYSFYKKIKKLYYCHFYPNFPNLNKNNKIKIELFFNKIIQYFFIKKDINLLYFFKKDYSPKNIYKSIFNEGFEFMKNLGKKYSESLFEKFSSFENIYDFSKNEKAKNLNEMKFLLKKEFFFVNEIIKEILKILEILEKEKEMNFNIFFEKGNKLKDKILKIKNKKLLFLDFLKKNILFKFEVK